MKLRNIIMLDCHFLFKTNTTQSLDFCWQNTLVSQVKIPGMTPQLYEGMHSQPFESFSEAWVFSSIVLYKIHWIKYYCNNTYNVCCIHFMDKDFINWLYIIFFLHLLHSIMLWNKFYSYLIVTDLIYIQIKPIS